MKFADSNISSFARQEKRTIDTLAHDADVTSMIFARRCLFVENKLKNEWMSVFLEVKRLIDVLVNIRMVNGTLIREQICTKSRSFESSSNP